jgi:hypothetical protein
MQLRTTGLDRPSAKVLHGLPAGALAPSERSGEVEMLVILRPQQTEMPKEGIAKRASRYCSPVKSPIKMPSSARRLTVHSSRF